MTYVLAALLVVAAVLFVARPFLREPVAKSDRLSEPDELDRRRLALLEERDRSLDALRELEFDHRTGKLSDDDSSVTSLESEPSSSKKAKSASTGTPLKVAQLNTLPPQPVANACEEFPNGWIYCHQCCKKRDLEGMFWML